MRLTMTTIAKQAGVSTTTVSRVINNKPDVDENTRNRILKIIEEANYSPSPIYKGLTKNETNLLGLFTYALDHPWTVEILKGVSDKVSHSKYQLMFFKAKDGHVTPSEIDKISKEINNIISKGLVDGLVVIQPSSDTDYLSDLYNKGFPLVLIDDWGFMGELQMPSIGTDNYNGALEATRHLINLGHTRFGFITGPLEIGNNQIGCSLDRLAGFKAGLKEGGLDFDPNLIVQGDFSEESGYDCTLKLLEARNKQPGFTALIASNDLMALGAIKALKERNLKIPEDISLVGFDDIPVVSYISPALTTVRQPMQEMGKLAVEMLIEQIEGSSTAPKRIVLPNELKVRSSTGTNNFRG